MTPERDERHYVECEHCGRFSYAKELQTLEHQKNAACLERDAKWIACNRAERERGKYLAALKWIATFNTDGRPEHIAEWLRAVVDKARETLQCDLADVVPAPCPDCHGNGGGVPGTEAMRSGR